MLAADTSVTRVARLFGCSRVTVHKLVRRYHQTGNTVDAPRSGPRRATTLRQNLFKLLSGIYFSVSKIVTARRLHVSGHMIRNKIRNA